jgi:RNA polymerase sigma-70 factor, ECF subfamily
MEGSWKIEPADDRAGGGGRKLLLTNAVESRSTSYETVDPDVRLMLEVRDGNAAAFEELVLRYQNRLITVLQNLVHNRHRAEELAQEVFLRVFRARASYRPEARFATWLFTIAHNVASNALRAASRQREVNVSVGQSGEVAAKPMDSIAVAPSGLMPVRQMEKGELADIVRQAIDSLGERQRMAVMLSRFEHMSYQDIAETMGLSIQAVKSLLSRARDNLRQILEPYVQEGTRP